MSESPDIGHPADSAQDDGVSMGRASTPLKCASLRTTARWKRVQELVPMSESPDMGHPADSA
jgi:hypothetical protein